MTTEAPKPNPYDQAVLKAGDAIDGRNLDALIDSVITIQSQGLKMGKPRGDLFLLLENLTTAGAVIGTETNNPLTEKFQEMAEGFHAVVESDFPQKPLTGLNPMNRPK